jgi:hypothetical protein
MIHNTTSLVEGLLPLFDVLGARVQVKDPLPFRLGKLNNVTRASKAFGSFAVPDRDQQIGFPDDELASFEKGMLRISAQMQRNRLAALQ